MARNPEIEVRALGKSMKFESLKVFGSWVRQMYVDRVGVYSPLEVAAIERFAELFADEPMENHLDAKIIDSGRGFRFVVPKKPKAEKTPFDADLEEALAALETAKGETSKAIKAWVKAREAERNGKKRKVSIARVRDFEESYKAQAATQSRAQVRVGKLQAAQHRFRALRVYERDQEAK